MPDTRVNTVCVCELRNGTWLLMGRHGYKGSSCLWKEDYFRVWRMLTLMSSPGKRSELFITEGRPAKETEKK